MASAPTKTLSSRIDLAVHARVKSALRPGEKLSDFLAAAIQRELEARRATSRKATTLDELGELSKASLDKSTMNQAILRLIDSKLSRLLHEMDIQP